jgi:type I restriction enzyme, R subunit
MALALAMPQHESEWQTRKSRIDTRLKASGWKILPFDPSRPLSSYHRDAITEYETANGPVDYALAVDGTLLGVIEAKKVSLGPQNVLVQAERYSRGATTNPLDFKGFRVPFAYSTNGEVIWFHDLRDKRNRSRRLADFHTPSALTELLTRDFDTACAWFASHPNNHPLLRPYQIEANAAVEKAIAERFCLSRTRFRRCEQLISHA